MTTPYHGFCVSIFEKFGQMSERGFRLISGHIKRKKILISSG